MFKKQKLRRACTTVQSGLKFCSLHTELQNSHKGPDFWFSSYQNILKVIRFHFEVSKSFFLGVESSFTDFLFFRLQNFVSCLKNQQAQNKRLELTDSSLFANIFDTFLCDRAHNLLQTCMTMHNGISLLLSDLNFQFGHYGPIIKTSTLLCYSFIEHKYVY